MDLLQFLFLLYLGINVSAFNECNRCVCCKNGLVKCQTYNSYTDYCLDGCIDGYYGVRCQHACINNCRTCSNQNVCFTCRSGYFGNYCEKCPNNCLTCYSKSYCNTCRDGFYDSDCRYKCQDKCEACTSYDECTSCKSGFYNGYQYSNSISYYYDCRHPCEDRCKSCTSYYTCTECKDGNYNGDYNNCRESCHSACKACTSYNNCTKCETGKYGDLCQNDCGLGCQNHDCDIVTGMCNCVSGFKGDKCDQCVVGFYGTNCNIPCPVGCLERKCMLNGDCYSCKNGFTEYMCDRCVAEKYGINCNISCPSGCKNSVCSRDGNCTEDCEKGFTGTRCDQCIGGTYGRNCDKNCLDNCSRCSDEASCSLCSPGYWGNTCLACPSNCLSCISSFSCSSCYPGYYGHICNVKCPQNCLHDSCDKTNGLCSSCSDGYYGNNCDMTCPRNCAGNVCSVDGKCFSCVEGYYEDKCTRDCVGNCQVCQMNNGLCQVCVNGYYGTTCDLPCLSNCRVCQQSNGYCTKCAPGYYNLHQTCSLCEPKCKTCTYFQYTCTSCTDGKFGQYQGMWYLHCNSDCPDNCFNITCDGKTGYCKYGCTAGFWGDQCANPCPDNCKDGECFDNNGTCKSGCKDDYKDPECMCPVNCDCDEHEKCTTCKDRHYNPAKQCTCVKDFCANETCKSCSNSSYYAENSLCCSCSSTCKNKKCESAKKCTDGCVDGYHSDDCSRLCKDEDQYCLKCTVDFARLSGECLECISGYYPHNTTKKCNTCTVYCLDEICDSVNGNCKKGCKYGYWGDMCKYTCERNCFKCNQHNGECSVCRNGKYLKDCSKACSYNCNTTNELIMCALDDGACLSGCDTPTKYGSHCENNCSSRCLNSNCNWKTGHCLNGCVDNFFGKQCKMACSVNCVTDIGDGRSCNYVNGDCIHGCKPGFHGDTCKKTCSENCVNNTCDKATGKCLHGCKTGFTGSSCAETLSQRGTDEDTTTATVGAAVGASLFTIIIIAVIIVLIVFKKRRGTEKEKRTDTNGSNDNAIVTYRELLTGTPVIDISNTDAVYTMPNKPKRNVPESESRKETTETKTVSYPDHEQVKGGSVAVYENAVVRDSQQKAAKGQFVKSALEIEEDLNNIALKESKTMAQTYGSCTYGSEAADTYYNVTAVKKRRIMLDKLADFVSTKTKEDLAEEFLQLPQGLIKPYIESQKRKNAPKNRYKGIYPYDDTRVVLKDGDSNYINASYIDGYVKRRAYIASIGPTYKYMGDMSAFWKMVWQEQAGKIVMLTKLSEAGVPKCDQYWPDKDFSELYANVQVTCKSEEANADYTVRSFVAQKGSEKRIIVQVHFTAWPDKGIPDDVTSLIEFRQKVNSIKTKLDGPIIVHCSAGIGRTGTYIALDSLTLEGEVEGGVDIYACVRNLREQRVNMVQTAEQYRYLHNAVVHTLTFENKAIEATKFSEYMNTHTDAHLAENFQKLQSSVENCPDDEIEAVMKNKSLNNKNRNGADIPGDRNRPRLYLDRNLGSSDYINALYVNSFKSVNRYIVAQTPMPDTVGDFLALIVQEKVTCVIDMESHMTKQDNVGAYFQADNQTLKNGTFTVKSEPGENTDQYIFRKLKVSHKKSDEITVKHIQFTKWDDKKNLPADPGDFVQFIRDIELKYCNSEKEGPILVHCLTGAEKSGLFCAVSVLLEKTQIDQEISVVNTVRQIKYRRHMSVPNKEQYIFFHQCLNEYLRSFDTYSNFGLKV